MIRLDLARGLSPVGGKLTQFAAKPLLVALLLAHFGGLPVKLAAATFSAPRFLQRKADGTKASTGRSARADARDAIPLDQLQPQVQKAISEVVRKPTIYRRLPVQVTQCDQSMYVFLVRNPEVVVNIWDVMGITQIKLERTGEYSFRGKDGHGTSTDFELVYGDADRHLVYGEGTYDGPLLPKPVRGRCVLLLRSEFGQNGLAKDQVTSKLDVFVELDNVALDVVAKTIQPILGRIADTNFQQTASFLGRISRTAEQNPRGMQKLIPRLTNVTPDVRQRFDATVSLVHERAIAHTAAQSLARMNGPK